MLTNPFKLRLSINKVEQIKSTILKTLENYPVDCIEIAIFGSRTDLSARFARLCDFLFQRVFRAIDQIELVDDGTAIDRLSRMEKRGIISSAEAWQKLRELINQITHEYLLESSDKGVEKSHQHSPELFKVVEKIFEYAVRV